MQYQIPHFKYLLTSLSSFRVALIEAEGKLIHQIEHLDEFYKILGYTTETAMAGILPDEFIWDEYIKDPAFSACMQLHIIKYLTVHSDTFLNKYGNDLESWIGIHAKARAESGVICAACRLNSFCVKLE